MAIQNPLYGKDLSEVEAADRYQPKSPTLTKLSTISTSTVGRVSFNGTSFTIVPVDTTTTIAEGNNLYFTDSRARAAITGAISTLTTSDLTPSRVVVSDANGKVTISTVSTTELGYIAGSTSPIQAQITGLSTAITNLTTTSIPEGSNQYFTPSRVTSAITGAISNITTTNLTPSKALVSDDSGKVTTSPITTTELGYLAGTTSNIQTQVTGLSITVSALTTSSIPEGSRLYFTNARVTSAITGAASTIATSNLTVSKVLISDGTGKVATSSVSSTELGYLSGATSNIQAQIAGLTTTSIPEGSNLYFTSARAVASLTGAASSIATTNLPVSKVLVSDSAGKVSTSTVTPTELGYLGGSTSNIQTQITGISNTVAALTTTSIPEGTNQYFTTSRVISSLSGAISPILTSNLTLSRALISDATGKVSASTVTSTELGYLSGATSSIQTQITSISNTVAALTTTSIPEGSNQYFTSTRAVSSITGAASSIATSNLTISRALISDGTGKVTTSSVSSTELGYLSGTTSPIQAQLNTISGRAITVGSGMTGGGTLSSNISLGLSFEDTPANIKMAGTQAVGILNTIARGDHVHPSDTTKVNTSLVGVANGIASLGSDTKVPFAQIPTATTTVGFGGASVTTPSTVPTGLTIPIPVSQGGTGATTAAGGLSALGGQPINFLLTSISNTADAGILCRDGSGQAFPRSIQAYAPLTITNPTGVTGNPILILDVGVGVGSVYKGADNSLYPRQIEVSSPLSITNADGVAGNPTISLTLTSSNIPDLGASKITTEVFDIARIPNIPWANVSSKPTTVSGFGITDTYTKTEADTLLASKSSTTHTHTTFVTNAVTGGTLWDVNTNGSFNSSSWATLCLNSQPSNTGDGRILIHKHGFYAGGFTLQNNMFNVVNQNNDYITLNALNVRGNNTWGRATTHVSNVITDNLSADFGASFVYSGGGGIGNTYWLKLGLGSEYTNYFTQIKMPRWGGRITIDQAENNVVTTRTILTSDGVTGACHSKTISGTTPSTQGADVTIAHGLTVSKIRSFSICIDCGGGILLNTPLTHTTGYQFDHHINNTTFRVINIAGNSSNILSKPFYATIWYVE